MEANCHHFHSHLEAVFCRFVEAVSPPVLFDPHAERAKTEEGKRERERERGAFALERKREWE